MEIDAVVSNLRAVLLSTKGGVPINKVMRDYKSMVGESIQYKRLGYNSLESFIKSVPGFRVINVGGETLVDAVPSEQTEHVAALINKQRNGSKKTKAYLPSAFKPRVPHYQSFPKKPPLKFPRPAIAPRFAAASRKQTERFHYTDDIYGSETEELNNTTVKSPDEEKTPETKYESYDTEENSLNDQLLHLSMQEQTENKVQNVPTDFNRSSDASESEENSVFMSRLAQLTSQIHSSNPDSSLDVPAHLQCDFHEDILNARLTRLTGHMHNKERATDSVFSEDFSLSNSSYDDDDENNIFNKRLAHFSSKLYNKPSPHAFENDTLGKKSILSAHYGHFPSSNNHYLMKQSFSTPEMSGFYSSATVPPQYHENSILKFPQKRFPNDICRKVVSPNSKDIFNSHSFIKSGPSSSDILSVQIPHSESQITSGNNGDVPNLQTPSPSGSYASVLSECDRNSIYTFSRNPQSVPSEVTASLVSSGSLSPKSDISGATSMPLSQQGIRNSRSSMKSSELPDIPNQILTNSRQRNGSIFSDIGFDDLRVTSEPFHLIKSSASLPDLVLPEEDIWNVFVLCALSTQEIWANIIGKEYSDTFEAMAQRMEIYYDDSAVRSASFEIGCLYAVQINGLWYRVQLEDIDGKDCYVFLLDVGVSQLCPLSALCILDQRFTFVPAQAICLSLFGLEDYVDNITTSELLGEYVHKPFVAEVVHRDAHTSVISVHLFDVSTGSDVVINDVIKKHIS